MTILYTHRIVEADVDPTQIPPPPMRVEFMEPDYEPEKPITWIDFFTVIGTAALFVTGIFGFVAWVVVKCL